MSLILSLFGCLAIVFGVMLSAVLACLPSQNSTANRYLSAAVFFITLYLVEVPLSFYPEYYLNIPHWLGIPYCFDYLIAPLIYLYAKTLCTPNFRFGRRQWVHFIPTALVIVVYIPMLTLSPEAKTEIIRYYLMDGELSDAINHSLGLAVLRLMPSFVVVQYCVYLVLLHLMLIKHEKLIKHNFSSIETINLSWLKTLATIFLVVIIATEITSTMSLNNDKESIYVSVIFGFFVAFLLFGLGAIALFQRPVFTGIYPIDKTELSQSDSTTQEKYARSGLEESTALVYKTNIESHMTNRKPYLQPDLTLADLAAPLGIQPLAHLSEVLNMHFGENFFDYINKHRIEESKKMLSNPDQNHLTILEIAEQSGFNSKSAFYRAFKKHTDTSPTEYRQRKLSGSH